MTDLAPLFDFAEMAKTAVADVKGALAGKDVLSVDQFDRETLN